MSTTILFCDGKSFDVVCRPFQIPKYGEFAKFLEKFSPLNFAAIKRASSSNELLTFLANLFQRKLHREIHVTLPTNGALFSIKHFHNFASRHVLSLATLNQAS
jgi:proline dehydrogenase